MRYAIVMLALSVMAGCAPKKAETKAQLTEHQRDSVLATEPIPGAPAVGAALKMSDKAAADAQKMNAQVDSLTH